MPSRRTKGILAAGALTLMLATVPTIIRKADHRRDVDAGLLEDSDLELEHVFVESLDGTPLHVTMTGEGDRTLFLIPGWTCNETVFRLQQRHFADRYRVVSLELRGHGGSEVPASLDYHHDRLAEDLKAVIDYVDPSSFAVGGFSMGGFTTLKFHERFGVGYADRMKGIALIDSSGLDLLEGIVLGNIMRLFYPFPLSPIITMLGRPSRFLDRIMELLKDTSFAYLVVRALAFGKKPSGCYVEHQREMSFSTKFVSSCLAVKSMLEYHVDHHLPNIDLPVLLLVGDRDKLTNVKANEGTAALLPDARVTVFEGAGHCALMEQWLDFNAELDSFLSEVFSSQVI
jgi:pimeloyl-ACP methyl ester carboxylesterase